MTDTSKIFTCKCNSLVMLKRDSIACSKFEIMFIAVSSFLVDLWEIPKSEIVLGKELSSGLFGVSVNHLF